MSTPDHSRPRAVEPMPGVAVAVGEWPAGCAFAPRCGLRSTACESAMPALASVGDRHAARCIRPRDVAPIAAATETRRLPERSARTREVLLSLEGVHAEHRGAHETVAVVQDVTFAIRRGACVAMVGESGSGKTTVARVIAGLHPRTGGEVRLEGHVLQHHARHRSAAERRRIQIIFQDPADALNPRHTVRSILARPGIVLRGMTRHEAAAGVGSLLQLVRLPQRMADQYPAELSGGERQRVGIARALAAGPELLVCDEITSALDVSVQAAVLELLAELQERLGLALLLITHDFGVVSAIADEVLVLERGRICESGPAEELLSRPAHDYTRRLLAAAPALSDALEPDRLTSRRPPVAYTEG